ncbi:hypothetical protein HYV74_00605 [Candidatus Uhrbacteria bacterium]|nr:hypothetical protein [Candidatus Uhrbacteria bacterium]
MARSASFLAAMGGCLGVFCPACIPALAVFLPTIGLGFLASLTASWLLLLVAVGGALLGLHLSALVHRRHAPFFIGLFASLLLIAGRGFFLDRVMIWTASAGLLIAAVWDYRCRRKSTAAVCVPATTVR